MGKSVNNLEAVTDYADNQHYLRLHRDIALPSEVLQAVRRLLDAGRWEEAKSITLEHAAENAHAAIVLFFDATAERLSADGALRPTGVSRSTA